MQGRIVVLRGGTLLGAPWPRVSSGRSWCRGGKAKRRLAVLRDRMYFSSSKPQPIKLRTMREDIDDTYLRRTICGSWRIGARC